MQIDGKRVVITGAASGIGRALLAELATYNVDIIAADIDKENLAASVSTPQNPRATLQPFVCDISDRQGVDELFAHALAAMGGVDIFIANAGFAYYEEIGPADWARMERICNTNTVSPIYAAAKMRDLHPEAEYMTVITSSTMAHWGFPGYALYSATKAALDRFADTYRFELPANGHLMLVYPIATRTPFFSNRPPVYPNQPPEVVARATVRGIARGRRSVYPSPLWVLAAVLQRVLPFIKPTVQWVYLRQFKAWKAHQAGSREGARNAEGRSAEG